ncbi:hypothetical protein [Plantibacter sp. Leaf314]|uniref:hypothetical protein n=1 Tax=Plantibacter sp. Leaf314 TaxID=1736333 RepID=UPI0006FBEA44|nr:hypothetical protein [Plantibacter sp. Leaf314]KQQ52428.1 hypothetical protein ASF68_08860 [Plantibacter sp. Leaf314]
MTIWREPGYRSGPVVFGWAFTVIGLGIAGGRLLSWTGSAHDIHGVVLGGLQFAMGVGTLIWIRGVTKRAREEERVDRPAEDATHPESAP